MTRFLLIFLLLFFFSCIQKRNIEYEIENKYQSSQCKEMNTNFLQKENDSLYVYTPSNIKYFYRLEHGEVFLTYSMYQDSLKHGLFNRLDKDYEVWWYGTKVYEKQNDDYNGVPIKNIVFTDSRVSKELKIELFGIDFDNRIIAFFDTEAVDNPKELELDLLEQNDCSKVFGRKINTIPIGESSLFIGFYDKNDSLIVLPKLDFKRLPESGSISLSM